MRFARYKFALLITDLFAAYLCFMGAMWLRFGGVRGQEFVPAVFLPLVAAVVFQYYGLYKINVFLNRSLSAVVLFKSLVFILSVYLLGAFLTRFAWFAPSRLAFTYFAASLFLFFGVYRVLLFPALFRRMSNAGLGRRKVLIVGANNSGRQIAASLTYRKELGADVIGFLDDKMNVGSPVTSGIHILGDTSSLTSIVETNLCDEVVIAGDHLGEERLLTLIASAKRTRTTVKVVSDVFRTVCQNSITESYDLQPTATLTRGLYSPVTAVYQRIADLLISGIGLIIISPLLVAAAVTIKATSRGPVFYRHRRIGKSGKPFVMLKFRSMYVSDSEDEKRKEMMLRFMKEGRETGKTKFSSAKVLDESRLTWIGRILRKTSLDEMPQLLNVIKGDMSLVGPRPVLPYEFEAMKEWHKERNRVLPGCTGFWQVYGRARTCFDDMVIMDIYMNENMSPWLYLQLLFKTIPVLLSGSGGK